MCRTLRVTSGKYGKQSYSQVLLHRSVGVEGVHFHSLANSFASFAQTNKWTIERTDVLTYSVLRVMYIDYAIGV